MSLRTGPNSPELLVEIDFTNNPTNATRAYTDVTADVRQLSYQSDGRNHELSRTDVGTLSAVLNNRHGHYDPTNPSSPRYPGVKRKRWIRVSAVWAGVTYRRWTGLIESWSQEWPAFGKDATVQITASSALSVLNLFDLDGLSYVSQATGTRTGAVLTSAGVTSYSVDTGASTVVAVGPFARDSPALAHLLDVEATENGRLFSKGDGAIQFQSRHYRLLNSSTPVGTIGDNVGEIRYRTGRLDLDDADLWDEVEVTPSGGTPETASDAASKLSHFTRRLNRDILSSSQSEALSAAQYLLSLYADPSPRIPQVELVGASDTGKWPQILTADVSDRFTWIRRADAHTIEQDVFVERYSDTVAPGRDWRVTLQLSPADDQAGWLLGDATYSVLGSTTVLTY